MEADKKPICVTGATGYVAGWIVKGLLEAGYTVHAPVRDPDNADKLKYLNEIAQNSTGSIRYFKADLLEPHSYSAAMADCEIVLHTASPFTTKVDDPQKELIEPALEGTRNVLNSVKQTASVQRVVLTSSIAAIYSDNVDLQETTDGKFTEDQWNEHSSLKHQPYYYSKTLAEREAWKIADAQDRWSLVVINPTLVIGPGISPNATSDSFKLIRSLGDGSMQTGVPDLELGVVDVRDVAQAHLAAAFDETTTGRHIVSAANTSLWEMAEILKERFGDQYKFPKRKLPKALVWLIGPFVDATLTRKFVSRNVGYPFVADNSKSIEQFHLNYRPLETSLVEMFEQFDFS